MEGYRPIKGDKQRRVLDPSGNIISRRQYQKALHGGQSPERYAKSHPKKPAPKYKIQPVKTPNGNVYHVKPQGTTTVRDQYTTNAKPGSIPKTTPSMWRVRRVFGEIGKKASYSIGITGRLKRSGEAKYSDDDAPTVTKMVVLPYRDVQRLMFQHENTLDFANAVTAHMDWEWLKIYSINVMEHKT